MVNKSVSQEHQKRKNTNFTSRGSATVCKLRNVRSNVTSICHKTLLLRHLENLRIKRSDVDEEGKRSFDYFQPLREPLLVHLTSASQGWNVPRSFFPNFRHEFYISRSKKGEEVSKEGVTIKENAKRRRNRKREKWEKGLREFFLASRRWACKSSTSDPPHDGAPILRYRNASCKPNSNYKHDDTTPLVSHTAMRVF